MRVGIIAAHPAPLAATFLRAKAAQLAERGIHIAALVVDDAASKRRSPLKNAARVAQRQAKISGCSTATAMMRLVTYRALVRHEGEADQAVTDNAFELVPRIVRVPTSNSEACVAAIRESQCDVVCLMGTRILTRKTLEGIACPTINIHSSDPRFVRGGPVVVWEVLAELDTITLTIHAVAVEVDSGPILLQKEAPIIFDGGLGATTRATMANAEPLVADLFATVLLDLSMGRSNETPFTPGPLRVTPAIPELLRADSICRRRSRGHGLALA